MYFLKIVLSSHVYGNKKAEHIARLFGRDDWIRTSDHTHPMRVRYQTAPHPENGLQKYKLIWNGIPISTQF